MKIVAAILPLLALCGFAQVAPAPSKNMVQPARAASAVHAGESAVAPETPVIILNGVCKTPAAKDRQCKTVITRAEFERLMTILSRQRNGKPLQSIPPDAKRQLALQYSHLLVFADMAEKQGLENTPEAKELIKFVRLQAMTEEMARALQQKAAPGAEEIRSYYEHNPERYTKWDLERVVVPLGPKADKEQLKKLAQELRLRASTGADFASLQKEAFDKSGTKTPAEVKIVLKPGTAVPEAHAAIYKLKAGEVSQVVEDPAGFYIYKLDSSTLTPFEENRAAIQELLAGQKTHDAIQQLLESKQPMLNQEYFGAASPSSAPTALQEKLPAGAK